MLAAIHWATKNTQTSKISSVLVVTKRNPWPGWFERSIIYTVDRCVEEIYPNHLDQIVLSTYANHQHKKNMMNYRLHLMTCHWTDIVNVAWFVVSCWRFWVVAEMWCAVDSACWVIISSIFMVVDEDCCVPISSIVMVVCEAGGVGVEESGCCIVALLSGLLLPGMLFEVQLPKAEFSEAKGNSSPVIWCRNQEISSGSRMDWWLDDNLNSPIRNCWNE